MHLCYIPNEQASRNHLYTEDFLPNSMAEKVDKTGYAVQMSHERKQHTAIVWALHLLCTAEIEE